jgi:DNA-binding response OmpR family regulator
VRILLVEDDRKTAGFIVRGLKEAGYAVDHAEDGEKGLMIAAINPYDVAIVDIMLPKIDGLTLIEKMRRKQINTPVLILSAKRTVEDRVKGLQKGGDDYLIKPFSFSELLARTQALIRRSHASTAPSTLTVGDLTLDLLKHEVNRRDRKIDLQPREFSLLEYLMYNKERIVSKTMILEHVWDYSFDPQTNVVDVLVCRLRNKVDRDFPQKLIHTIRSVGYVIKDPSQDS